MLNAAAVLNSFNLTVKPDETLSAGLDVDARRGQGGSGNLGEDTLVAAGLPQMPRLAGEAKSYSERLFRFPSIGSLPPRFARDALREPAAGLGVRYEDEAADLIVEYTEGYPYFLQEYGKVIRDESSSSLMTLEDARAVLPLVEARLDESFFKVRAERTTPLELQYLRAMAELGPDPAKASEVARALGRRAEQMGPTRSRLIDKGLLYTPSHGLAAFTVPQFDRFLRRTYEIVPFARGSE